MRTKLISLLLATAIASTAPLAPAQANPNARNGERTAAALIFGLATLAIIAKAAEDRKDAEKKKEKKDKPPAVALVERPPQIITGSSALPHVYPPGRGSLERRPHRALAVPSSCARRVQTQGGVRTAFGAPCLRRAGVRVAQLPRRCERLANVGQRDVRIWGARCLTRNGVRID